MRRYRVTFRNLPGLGRRLKSTNVAAVSIEDALMRAVRTLTAYPAHRVQPLETGAVGGLQTRERGTIHLYVSSPAYWAGQVAESWDYEVVVDEASDFDLAGLVRMGQTVAPIPPRP
ncbi:MAG: hypothetical protein LCH53_13735 [Bacteroidetes bacterium]|nr:hypothetical protein [Bacteroidota bacterium]